MIGAITRWWNHTTMSITHLTEERRPITEQQYDNEQHYYR